MHSTLDKPAADVAGSDSEPAFECLVPPDIFVEHRVGSCGRRTNAIHAARRL